ncbi:MAG: hypothetical protein RLY20_979 [Verrucomicrobiota bacterium]
MNTDSTQPPPVPAETSLAAKLTNVFIAPGEVFEEIKSKPVCHTNWLVAGLIFILLSWCGNAVKFSQESIRHEMAEIQGQAMQKSFQKQIDAGKMTQAQADQIKAQAAGITNAIMMIGAFLGPVMMAAIIPFVTGFIWWCIAHLLLRQPIEYLKAVEAAGLLMVIVGLGALVKGLLAAAMGTQFVSAGPVLLVRPVDPTRLLHMVLMSLDVFAVWGTVLNGIALAKLTGASFVKAFTWVLILTVVIMGGMLTLGWAAQHMVPK